MNMKGGEHEEAPPKGEGLDFYVSQLWYPTSFQEGETRADALSKLVASVLCDLHA